MKGSERRERERKDTVRETEEKKEMGTGMGGGIPCVLKGRNQDD
jgi:hypothetical protein